jgi:hypothetical protein
LILGKLHPIIELLLQPSEIASLIFDSVKRME